MDKITDYGIELARRIVEKPTDIYRIEDDYSDKGGIADVARRKDIPTFPHTDANPSDIPDDLAEVGIAVINPVQLLAIDPRYVRNKLGDRLCLFGKIDIQHASFRIATGRQERNHRKNQDMRIWGRLDLISIARCST